MANILQIANSGSRKTRLLSGGNLSYNRLQSCLEELLNRNLIEITQVDTAVIYRTTLKGNEFVTNYTKLKKLIT